MLKIMSITIIHIVMKYEFNGNDDELNSQKPKQYRRNMLYLKSFKFSSVDDHSGLSRVYPYNIMKEKSIQKIDFAPITIFYGDNGSGKSTILNIIADRIHIPNKTDGNYNSYYDDFVKMNLNEDYSS